MTDMIDLAFPLNQTYLFNLYFINFFLYLQPNVTGPVNIDLTGVYISCNCSWDWLTDPAPPDVTIIGLDTIVCFHPPALINRNWEDVLGNEVNCNGK